MGKVLVNDMGFNISSHFLGVHMVQYRGSWSETSRSIPGLNLAIQQSFSPLSLSLARFRLVCRSVRCLNKKGFCSFIHTWLAFIGSWARFNSPREAVELLDKMFVKYSHSHKIFWQCQRGGVISMTTLNFVMHCCIFSLVLPQAHWNSQMKGIKNWELTRLSSLSSASSHQG